MRRAIAWWLVFVLSGLPGCAMFRAEKGEPPLPPPGRIAVMPSPDLPAIEFGGYLRGKGEGAAAGAAAGGLTCLSALGHGSCAGAFCGAAILLLLAVCGVVTAVTTVTGAVMTPDAEVIQQREQAMQYATYNTIIQKPLRDYVVSAALENFAEVANIATLGPDRAGPQDYRRLAALGVDTVLETGLTRAWIENVGLETSGLEGHSGNLQLFMEGKLRVIRVQDNQLLRETSVRYHAGPPRSLEEWSAHNGKQLEQELAKGYEPLAAYLYTKTFLVFPFPDRSFTGIPSTFGLAPLEPALALPPFEPFAPKTGPVDFSRPVDSLQPVLRWQAFPRDSDRKADPATLSRIQNVRYDLRVGVLMKDASIKTVYERQALPTAEHRIETDLLAGARYYWTVRARFELDGRTRVTEWSSLWHSGDHQEPPFPSTMSYSFRTPGP